MTSHGDAIWPVAAPFIVRMISSGVTNCPSGFSSAWCTRRAEVFVWLSTSADWVFDSSMAIETEPLGPIMSFTKKAVSLIIGTPFFVVFGTLSDRIGRKPVLIMTTCAAALTYVAFAYAPSLGVAITIVLAGEQIDADVGQQARADDDDVSARRCQFLTHNAPINSAICCVLCALVKTFTKYL
mgnify:CR=1 FL=1